MNLAARARFRHVPDPLIDDAAAPLAAEMTLHDVLHTLMSSHRLLPMVFSLSLLVQLALLPFGNFRYDTHLLAAWAERLHTVPLAEFYATPHPADHLPGDLWILAAVGYVHRQFWSQDGPDAASYLTLLKLVPVLANLGTGAMLYLIGRQVRNAICGRWAATLWLLNPGPIFVAAFWGQWDAVSAFVTMLAVWLHLKGRLLLALPVLTCAALIKPPVAMLIPVFLLLFVRKRMQREGSGWWRSAAIHTGGSMLVAIATAWTVLRPFDVGLPLFPARWSIFERLQVTLDTHPKMTMNAMNIWALLHPGDLASGQFRSDTGRLFGPLSAQATGTLLLGAALLGVLVLCWRFPGDLTLVWAGFAVVMTTYMLPTRVHERYLFPAVLFATLVAVAVPRLWWVLATASGTYLLSLLWVYDQFYPIGIPADWDTPLFVFVLAAANAVLLVSIPLMLPAMLQVPGDGVAVPLIPDSLREWALRLNRIRVARVSVLVLTICLNTFRLGQEGYGNLYYAATVRSMLTGWHQFFFVSFDTAGFLAVDKPPLGFWLQAASVWVLGFHPWSLMLPQAVAGVLAVILLYSMVQGAFGEISGLLAALCLAVMPINVVVARNNGIDGLVMLTMLGAAWLTLQAVERGRVRELLLASAVIGLGFNIKMMEAFLIVPACFGVYFLVAPRTRLVRIGHLFLAMIVLACVSFAWMIAVDATPAADRPYVGSSLGNSEFELMLGHNGLDRVLPGGPIFRHENDPVAYSLQNSSISTAGMGARGPLRLIDHELGPQAGWLLPLALAGAIAGMAQVIEQRKQDRKTDRQQATLLLWVGWFGTMATFFSVANYFHRYYLVVLTPAIAALVGIGVPLLWRRFRQREHPGWLGWLLPVTLVATAGLQWHLLGAFDSWYRQAMLPVLGACIAAGSILIDRRRHLRHILESSRYLAAAGVLVLLLFPLVWSVLPVWQGIGDLGFPYAGPQYAHSADGRPSDADRELVVYLEAHRDQARYLVATTTAKVAAPLELVTRVPVLAIGGYSGDDPILDESGVVQMITSGDLRYVLLPFTTVRKSRTRVYGRLPYQQWVTAHCTEVPAAAWQQQRGAVNPRNAGQLTQVRVVIERRTLFDCQNAANGAAPIARHSRPIPVPLPVPPETGYPDG